MAAGESQQRERRTHRIPHLHSRVRCFCLLGLLNISLCFPFQQHFIWCQTHNINSSWRLLQRLLCSILTIGISPDHSNGKYNRHILNRTVVHTSTSTSTTRSWRELQVDAIRNFILLEARHDTDVPPLNNSSRSETQHACRVSSHLTNACFNSLENVLDTMIWQS